jgi:hypothetical protein
MSGIIRRLADPETVVGIIGIAATVAIGILGIIAAIAPDSFMGVTIVMAILGFVTFLLFLILLIFSAERQWRIPEGPYRTLTSSLHWDITGQDGSEATLVRTREMEFTQNNVMALREYVITDDIPPVIDDFKINANGCSPEAVAIKKEGNEWNILVSLNAVFHRHHRLTLTMVRKIKGAFTNPWGEYVTIRVPERTNALTVQITLPSGVMVKDGTPNIRCINNRGETPPQSLKSECLKTDQVTGRQRITWSPGSLPYGRAYRLSWQWQGITTRQSGNHQAASLSS